MKSKTEKILKVLKKYGANAETVNGKNRYTINNWNNTKGAFIDLPMNVSVAEIEDELSVLYSFVEKL